MSMPIFYDPTHVGHAPAMAHPERPDRIEACVDALKRDGFDTFISPEEAPFERMAAVHAGDHLNSLVVSRGRMIDMDTYLTPDSMRIAARAAGAVCAAVDGGGISLCLTRPPGHHAETNRAMGFCLVNNLAVGAAHALASGAADRVAVVDFDVHHGNGTQQIFWEDPRVLYISLHQYPWYPWESGALSEIGAGAGEGFNVNVPLPAMTGDDVYVSAMARIVLPILESFRPQLLFVSAGFDAHDEDPLSLQEVSDGGFAMMISLLKQAADQLCEGRLVAALEGGYSPSALPRTVVRAARAMQGLDGILDAGELSEGLPFGAHGLNKVIGFHSKRWNL